jgi:DNA-binding MarR family transcriptional regulator
MNYTLLQALLPYLEDFQAEHPDTGLADFVIWLNNKLFAGQQTKAHSEHDNLLIAFKIMHLNKELKKQTKKALSASGMSSIDEYSFLLHLDHQDSFRKMEIIALHNLEAPTGIEIIKRLLRNQRIEEFADPDDKRAKRIKITKKGTRELAAIKPQIDRIFHTFSATLQLNEKIQISGILDKLIA